jgi:stage V sporulation protein R
MTQTFTVADLEEWDARIRERVEAFGLDCYSQEFEVCDQNQMIGYMAYSGMPSHYPHWSYGKSFEKLKTLYDYGVSGLPYEMVINSNPALAYLMRDNSLLLQILTMAHVYGHNDFFKNNFTFRSTRAEYTIGTLVTPSNPRLRGGSEHGLNVETCSTPMRSVCSVLHLPPRSSGRTPGAPPPMPPPPRPDPFHRNPPP